MLINNSVVDNPGMFEPDDVRKCRLCGTALREDEDLVCAECDDRENEEE